METHTEQVDKKDWITKFLDEGKEIMGMDCSGLVGIVSHARSEGYSLGVKEGREAAVKYISENDDVSMMSEEQFDKYDDLLRNAQKDRHPL